MDKVELSGNSIAIGVSKEAGRELWKLCFLLAPMFSVRSLKDMKTRLFSLFAALVALTGTSGCASGGNTGASQRPVTPQPEATVQNTSQSNQSNLIALFLVKKDNLTNEFRGEIYPIALHINGGYVDASKDITREIRDNFQEDILIRNNLDRDGKPEVFGVVRKGRDPKSIDSNQTRRPEKIAYANVWLSYKTGQPTQISSEVLPYEFPVSRTPYNVAGFVDVDGIDEVVVQNNGYESTSFSIYQLKNNQLTQVFAGASYGC